MSAPLAGRITVGIDLVSIERVKGLLERQPNARQRLFSEDELAYCERHGLPEQHLAARFAAKEAVFKALGHGIGQGPAWRDVEVISDERGRPSVSLSGAAEELAREQGVVSIEISLSHDAALAIAEAIAVRGEPE